MSSDIRVLTPLMPAEVTVVVATFGDTLWAERGLDKALVTFLDQTYVPETIWVHGDTLAEARNHGGHLATTDWLVFLDADDRLESFYCGAIIHARRDRSADVLQPSVRGFRGDEFIEDEPVFHPKIRPLIQQNYIIIGAPVRTDLFREVGGFDEWPCLEDWAFWLKCQRAGAAFGELPDAIYLINDNHERNRGDQDTVARKIRETYR